MAFYWSFETAEGAVFGDADLPLPDVAATEHFLNQSDAESWIGETWRELSEVGVATVTLFEDDRQIYGPMSLSE